MQTITPDPQFNTVTGTDFSISFSRHGVYACGLVQTWKWQPECRIEGSHNRRLEKWNPCLVGTVWRTEENWDLRQGVGELRFASTPEGTPILILDANGRPLIEWHKGRLTYFKSNA